MKRRSAGGRRIRGRRAPAITYGMSKAHRPDLKQLLFILTMSADGNALDEVRAGEARRMVREGYDPVLKNKRWCLLKRPENLTDKQSVSLRELLAYNLKSVRAYLLK